MSRSERLQRRYEFADRARERWLSLFIAVVQVFIALLMIAFGGFALVMGSALDSLGPRDSGLSVVGSVVIAGGLVWIALAVWRLALHWLRLERYSQPPRDA